MSDMTYSYVWHGSQKEALKKRQATQEKGQEKAQAQQEVKNVFTDPNNPWAGLDCLEDWIEANKLGLEDLEQGRDLNGNVKAVWRIKVRGMIRDELSKWVDTTYVSPLSSISTQNMAAVGFAYCVLE